MLQSGRKSGQTERRCRLSDGREEPRVRKSTAASSPSRTWARRRPRVSPASRSSSRTPRMVMGTPLKSTSRWAHRGIIGVPSNFEMRSCHAVVAKLDIRAWWRPPAEYFRLGIEIDDRPPTRPVFNDKAKLFGANTHHLREGCGSPVWSGYLFEPNDGQCAFANSGIGLTGVP
jgi:hypothetical protein